MANKLLLIEDVEELGRSGDIVSVRPGYARNYLLPQGFAVPADKRALRMQARLKEERLKRAVEDKKESEELATRLAGVVLSVVVKVDQEGHMYGSVSALDVVHLLKNETGIELEKRSVQLKHAIKETGTYPLVLKLKEGITADVTLKVIPEGGELASAEKPAAQQ
jgi:large subunit ribosomal protein L9